MSTLRNEKMVSETQLKAIAKYKKKAIKKYLIELNKTTDADMIAYLDAQSNKQGLIKQLIREHMNKGSE